MSKIRARQEDGSVIEIPIGKAADGKTPVKGEDYFTAADKAELVSQVKASLTTETWTFTLANGSTVTKKVVIA